nr:hypothetical protein [Escherichia coli]
MYRENAERRVQEARRI